MVPKAVIKSVVSKSIGTLQHWDLAASYFAGFLCPSIDFTVEKWSCKVGMHLAILKMSAR